LNAIPPSMEQPEYNLFRRHKVEVEFAPLYQHHGLGTTIWSPLDSGILTGKYNSGIPANSRLAANPELRELLTTDKISMVKRLGELAESLNCTLPQLAIAWCLKNPHVSSVIMGASHPGQIRENIQALEVKHRLTAEVMQRIDIILQGRLIKL
ncbi:MAG: aldo/keto reductase, partial [Parachlamydia sp.]|nr:aldo/keto reductase [Parachlamydia sp.]